MMVAPKIISFRVPQLSQIVQVHVNVCTIIKPTNDTFLEHMLVI